MKSEMAIVSHVPRTEASISRVTRLSSRVQGISVRGPKDYTWKSGQHVLVSAEKQGGAAAYYSIASAPSAGEPGVFELAARVESIPWGPETEVGSLVFIGPAGGSLPIERLSLADEVILIAMGTGVAPLRAVLQHLMVSESAKVRLIHGARIEEDLLYFEEFVALSGERFSYEPVLSQEEGAWLGKRGRVQEHLSPISPFAEYCVCGSREMVAEVELRLIAGGVSFERIYTEGYS